MFFSLVHWPISFLFALLGAGIAVGLSMLVKSAQQTAEDRRYSYRDERKPLSAQKRTTLAALITFIISLFLVHGMMYYGMPAFQGSFFGYFEPLLACVVPAVAVGIFFAGASRRSLLVGGAAVAILFGVPFVQYGFNAWGGDNAQRFAHLANITTASKDAHIPPTDPDHMVLVTKTIAAFKGQSALSTQGALGSRFSVSEDSYQLQSIKGHRYWVAPLTFHNTSDQWNQGNPESPGYVVVDAENPEVDAELKLGFHIRLFTDQMWSLKVQRWVYEQGFNEGILDAPIFEVDDDWQPYWSIGYIKRPFGGGIAGQVLDKVILVNVAQAEPSYKVYDFTNKPAWLDRVMSQGLVHDYVNDWGWWSGDYARNNFWTVQFGFNKTGTMQPAEEELAYTTAEHNAWIVPMTSTTGKDHAVLGVVVYETSENKATYYPGINGFNVGESVKQTMQNARDNIKHYEVESVQLYEIYGQLTWVAIYTAPQSIGKSFGGIGILHAHSQNAADVIFANDKATALQRYASQVAGKTNGGGSISQTASESTELHGKIKRIALLPTTGSTPTYIFVVEGDAHTYIITRDTYARIPLVREGDEVTFRFLDTHATEQAVGYFKDKQVD